MAVVGLLADFFVFVVLVGGFMKVLSKLSARLDQSLMLLPSKTQNSSTGSLKLRSRRNSYLSLPTLFKIWSLILVGLYIVPTYPVAAQLWLGYETHRDISFRVFGSNNQGVSGVEIREQDPAGGDRKVGTTDGQGLLKARVKIGANVYVKTAFIPGYPPPCQYEFRSVPNRHSKDIPHPVEIHDEEWNFYPIYSDTECPGTGPAGRLSRNQVELRLNVVYPDGSPAPNVLVQGSLGENLANTQQARTDSRGYVALILSRPAGKTSSWIKLKGLTVCSRETPSGSLRYEQEGVFERTEVFQNGSYLIKPQPLQQGMFSQKILKPGSETLDFIGELGDFCRAGNVQLGGFPPPPQTIVNKTPKLEYYLKLFGERNSLGEVRALSGVKANYVGYDNSKSFSKYLGQSDQNGLIGPISESAVRGSSWIEFDTCNLESIQNPFSLAQINPGLSGQVTFHVHPRKTRSVCIGNGPIAKRTEAAKFFSWKISTKTPNDRPLPYAFVQGPNPSINEADLEYYPNLESKAGGGGVSVFVSSNCRDTKNTFQAIGSSHLQFMQPGYYELSVRLMDSKPGPYDQPPMKPLDGLCISRDAVFPNGGESSGGGSEAAVPYDPSKTYVVGSLGQSGTGGTSPTTIPTTQTPLVEESVNISFAVRGQTTEELKDATVTVTDAQGKVLAQGSSDQAFGVFRTTLARGVAVKVAVQAAGWRAYEQQLTVGAGQAGQSAQVTLTLFREDLAVPAAIQTSLRLINDQKALVDSWALIFKQQGMINLMQKLSLDQVSGRTNNATSFVRELLRFARGIDPTTQQINAVLKIVANRSAAVTLVFGLGQSAATYKAAVLAGIGDRLGHMYLGRALLPAEEGRFINSWSQYPDGSGQYFGAVVRSVVSAERALSDQNIQRIFVALLGRNPTAEEWTEVAAVLAKTANGLGSGQSGKVISSDYYLAVYNYLLSNPAKVEQAAQVTVAIEILRALGWVDFDSNTVKVG